MAFTPQMTTMASSLPGQRRDHELHPHTPQGCQGVNVLGPSSSTIPDTTVGSLIKSGAATISSPIRDAGITSDGLVPASLYQP